MMTPSTFAGSAIVLVGLIGFVLLFQTPLFGIALIGIAVSGAYRLSQNNLP